MTQVGRVERPRAYRDVRLGELLTLLAEDYPQNEALIYPDRSLSYDFSQLEWLARQVAKGLLSLGIQRGDRVALWAPNVPNGSSPVRARKDRGRYWSRSTRAFAQARSNTC